MFLTWNWQFIFPQTTLQMTWFGSWTLRASSSLCCCSTPPATRRCQLPTPGRPTRPRTSVTNFLVSDTISSISPKPYPVLTPPRARTSLGPGPPSTGGWLEAEHVRVSPARHCRDTWPSPRCAPPSPESCSRDTAAPPTMSSGQHRSPYLHIYLHYTELMLQIIVSDSSTTLAMAPSCVSPSRWRSAWRRGRGAVGAGGWRLPADSSIHITSM